MILTNQKFFNFFIFGESQSKKPQNFVLQKYRTQKFLEIFPKFQKEVLEDINGHLTGHGISSCAPMARWALPNVQTCSRFGGDMEGAYA